MEELHDLLKESIMIRRKKEDVLTDLPAKQRSMQFLDIDQKIYETHLKELQKWFRENPDNPAAAMVEIEKLKQATAESKLDNAIKWISDFIETEKLVVFCTHKVIVKRLQEAFPASVALTGETSMQNRQKAVDTFQDNPDCKLFIGNIKAAGVGITLTAASNVAFIEFDFSPSNHLQAEDRTHRIGQKDSVTAYYLVAENTIDEDIFALLERKNKILDQVLDGNSSDDVSIFTDLLAIFKKD